MQVPFEKIGPGQSGRLVYQVIGVNGPVFNPDRIRYLPPDQAPNFENQPLNLPSTFTAFAAVNLAASMGNLALSAAVLRQVQQLHAKMDRVLFSLGRVEAKVDRLVKQVQRIDARVSENNLRHALDHILSHAVQDGEIDLRGLARVKNDLETFAEGIEGGFRPCDSFGLRLSSDVEDKLEAIYKLLFGVRYFVYTQHNALAQGDPLRTLSIDLVEDYLPGSLANPELAVAKRKVLEKLWGAPQQLGEKIYDDFVFAGEKEANEYSDWMEEVVVDPIIEALCEGDPGALILACQWEADTSDVEQAADYYSDLRVHWLWHTSAGLLWRTYLEVLGLVNGYNEMWDLGRERVEQLEGSKLMLSAPVEQEELERVLADLARK